RRAQLERRGGRHAVAALEQVVGEPAHLLVVEDAAQRTSRSVALVRLRRRRDRYDVEAIYAPRAWGERAQRGVPTIAAEDLAAAVAGERDTHLARCLACEEMQRDVGGAMGRCVARRD